MPDYDDSLIRDVLQSAPHIALVGASANPERDSFKVRPPARAGLSGLPCQPGPGRSDHPRAAGLCVTR